MLLHPAASRTNCSSPSLQDQLQTSPELHSIRSVEKFKRNSPLQHKAKLLPSSPSHCLCIRLPEGSHLLVRNQLSHRQTAKATSTLPGNLIQCMPCSGFEKPPAFVSGDGFSWLCPPVYMLRKRERGKDEVTQCTHHYKRPPLSQTEHGHREGVLLCR